MPPLAALSPAPAATTAPTFDDTCALAVELTAQITALLSRLPAGGPAAHAAADALTHAREAVHALTAVSMHGKQWR